MNKKINIGIIGCANIADRSVIPAIINLSNQFNLIAVASRSKEKANLFALKYNCEACNSYEEIIKRQDIDALYIPLPTGLHDEWVNKALNAGKHIYAEKSIASNPHQAKIMIENAKTNKVALMEGFMFQYHTQHNHVKQLISDGVIGEIRHFASSFGFPPLDKTNFRYDDIIGGGALLDAAAYPVRAAFFILGDQLLLSGASLHIDQQLKTNIFGSAYLKGLNGIGASISFGFDNYYQCSYSLWGSKGKITVEKAFTPRHDTIPTFKLETPTETIIIESTPDNHFEKAFIEFYNIIHNPNSREKHFKEILQQSKTLDEIRKQHD